MKVIFDAYLLQPFVKKFIFELVMRVRTRDYTVFDFIIIEDHQFLVEIKAIWISVIHLSDLDIKIFGLDLSPLSPCITYISQKQCSTSHGACTSEEIGVK